MQESTERVQHLMEYVKALKNNGDRKALYHTYQQEIESVKPQEAFQVFHGLLQEGSTPDEILTFLDKVINVFFKGLSNYQWERPGADGFLKELEMENKALEEKMNELRELIKEKDLSKKKKAMLPKLEEIMAFDEHYVKKENILFPYMEKAMPYFQGVSIMWALHGVVRKAIKNMVWLVKQPNDNERNINMALGDLFFGLLFLVKKEELILFPSASETLAEDDWKAMDQQRFEYEGVFIQRPPLGSDQSVIAEETPVTDSDQCYLKTETGQLGLNEINMIFSALPVDMTYVDESNKVVYFSRPKERIFPRSPAIIGRDVKNCHPPDSVHVVEEIIENFRSGKKDTANFWIQLKGRFLFIQYYALRDEEGNYRGTLEVSQDVTEIRQLEGERRLLQWESNE